MKKALKRRKHCTLAVVRQSEKFRPATAPLKTQSVLAVIRQSQNFRPTADPLPRSAGQLKFNQLEMVTTFTHRPSLVKIDAHNFKLLW